MEELEINPQPVSLENADDDNEPHPLEVSTNESDIFLYIKAVEVL